MHLANAHTLNSFLQYQLQHLQLHRPTENIILNLMYNTGCRPIEALEPIRWNYDGSNLITLQPAKGNNPRYFYLNQMPSNFLEDYSTLVAEARLPSYGKMQYYWSGMVAHWGWSKEQNKTLLYLFRHNYILNLQAEGWPLNQIQLAMGHLHIESTQNYINYPIHTLHQLPQL